MALLPHSKAGLQWSHKWGQPYFSVPPGVFPDPLTQNTNGSSATIFIDNHASLAPKYAWAFESGGGFGVWVLEGSAMWATAEGRAMWSAMPVPWVK